MYKRKIPLDLTCGISVASEVILSKWKFYILNKINEGIVRPKDILEAIQCITKRVLHEQLKQLEFYKIVERTVFSDEVPLRVEYSLTDSGKAILPLLTAVNQWGLDFVPQFNEIIEHNKG